MACPTQQPDSFAERMIYEVIIEELEEQVGAMHYVRRPDSRRVKNPRTCRWGAMPPIRNGSLKSNSSRRFGFGDSETPFEEYLHTGLPKLQYEYVATAFDLNAGRWDAALMKEHLTWIMDTFSGTPANVPHFVFFFVIFLRNVHVQPLQGAEKAIFEDIGTIVSENLHRATLISELVPVPCCPARRLDSRLGGTEPKPY